MQAHTIKAYWSWDGKLFFTLPNNLTKKYLLSPNPNTLEAQVNEKL